MKVAPHLNRSQFVLSLIAASALNLMTGCTSVQPGIAASDTQRPSDRCGLQFRWLNNAGFELILSNGSHVLVDPWLDSAKFFRFPLENISRADYLLLTHIHPDHADDVKIIQAKFPNVRIFVGALSAEPLVKWQKLNTARIYKVGDEQVFQFDDVMIKAFAGRHTESNRGNFLTWDGTGELTPTGWGTLELFQFMVTDTDGTKFMVWAGTPSIDNFYKLNGTKPDVAAVHISPKQDFAVLARIISGMSPTVVMPHHYDIWPTILRTMPAEAQQFPAEVQPVTPEDVIPKMMPYVAKQLAAGGMKARFTSPEHHVWYRFDSKSKQVMPGACAAK